MHVNFKISSVHCNMSLQATRGVYVPSPLPLKKKQKSPTLETTFSLTCFPVILSSQVMQFLFYLFTETIPHSRKNFKQLRENMEEGFQKVYTFLQYTTVSLQSNSIKKKSTTKIKGL